MIDIKIWNFNGETYFVGIDVASAIGYDNPAVAVMRCADSEDITVNEYIMVGGSVSVLLNQAAVYGLIYNSRTDKAMHFKRWFTYRSSRSQTQIKIDAVRYRAVRYRTPRKGKSI